MPIGGENIGEAYVRIYGDGSSLPDDIRDDLKKAEPGVRAQAKEHGDAYADEFSKRTSQKDLGKGIRDSLEKSMAKADVTDAYFGSKDWKQFVRRVKKEFGEAGEVAVASLESKFRERGDITGLDAEIGRIHTHVTQATRQILAEESKMLDDALDLNKRFDAERLRSHMNMLEEAHALNVDYDREQAAALRKRIEDEKRWRSETEVIYKDIDRLVKKSYEGIGRGWEQVAKHWSRIGVQTEGTRKKLEDLDHWVKSTDKSAFKAAHSFEAFNKKVISTGDTMGKVFGKGSRNDFFNFTGSIIGAMSKLPAVFGTLGDSVFKIKDAITGGGGAEGGITNIIGGLTANVFAFTAAIGAVLIGAGALSAFISGLAATVAALASSLIFAVAAGFGPLVAIILPLAAGIGAVVAGIAGLDGALKKTVTESLKPLKDTLGDLGDAAAEGLFGNIEEQAKRLNPVLKSFEGLAGTLGESMSKVGDIWIDMLNSAAFRRFRRTMETFLPDAVESLGTALSNTFSGFLGILRGAVPLAQDFLDWIVKVTDEFNKWANSKEGQDQIVSFFDRAKESAKAVGGFIGDIIDFIAKLSSAGKDTGDSLFTEMGDAIGRITTYISENPDAVGKWFKDGKDMAEEFGHVIEGIIDVFDALDTPETRKGLSTIMHILGQVLEIGSKVINKIDKVFHAISNFSGIDISLGGAAFKFPDVGHMIKESFAPARGTIQAFSRFFRTQLGNVGSNAKEVTNSVGGFFVRMNNRIMGAVAGIGSRIGSYFAPAVGRVADIAARILNFWTTLPGRVGTALTSIGSTIANAFNHAVSLVQGIPDRIVGFFAGLGSRILNAIGSVDIGSLIHIPDPGPGIPFVPGLASGGVTSGPILRWVGEAGPEAVVPLRRPLTQVDPAVRGLAAIAQGKVPAGGKTVDASGWTIVSPSADPAAVAQQVVNKMVAAAF